METSIQQYKQTVRVIKDAILSFYEYWMQYINCSPLASKLQLSINQDTIDIDCFSLQKMVASR